MSLIRRLGYVSNARIDRSSQTPDRLHDIVINSRRRNRQHAITGVLGYDKGVYIQVVEGDDGAIDELYGRILTDERHDNVAPFVDETACERIFSHSGLKLALSSHDSSLDEFIARIWGEIRSLPEYVVDRVGIFYPQAADSRDADGAIDEDLNPYEYCLTAFPAITVGEWNNPKVLELFARMKANWLSYESIISQCRDADLSGDQTLQALLGEGVLRSRAVDHSVHPADRDRREQAASSFSARLRRLFIGHGR